ncbi:glycoside hydrolase family 47 protein [Laccaria amethystina LaAM-08-1]|uniref:alpha-1,2-Mannosidase n=1 Tax=Laccaria amethystina LaAM-08-1 TaxID=1095629 RepID=A0A0C9WPK1_9AGAR|nr:glycoside hydrolase family 47 protein [Laccaria amethystina LaAM-08-1]
MILPTSTLVFALGAFLSLPSASLGGLVQKQGLAVPPAYGSHQGEVKQIFLDSYNAYKKFADGHDDVSPVSQTFSDGRNGWGATIIDAMSTMKIMDLNDLFADAVKFASNIDFSKSKTSDTVSVFETTIRYVGGLLSAYELSGKQYQPLLDKAKEVADKMAYAWVGKNNIPYGHIDFSTNIPSTATSNIAEAGTLTLEWARLAQYTGNMTYKALAENAALHIANLGVQFPGLPAQGIDPSTGLSVGKYITWGGGSDSYFEYLIKYARTDNSVSPDFADSWRTAVDSSIQVLRKTSTVGDHVYLADYDGSKIRHVGSHLACFHGGNWLLGGQLLNNVTIVEIGLELTDACWNTYARTATQIGPEVFAFISKDGGYTGGSPPSAEQNAFYELNGFYITAADYVLRPEVLESNFYAWRVTGNVKYLDRAASAIQSFRDYLSVKKADGTVGYVGIDDVDNKESSRIDDTESFWFAEVLKYLYLTFDDPSRYSLDEYVFNTEAHPLKVPSGTADATYGTGKLRTSYSPFKTTTGSTPAVSPIPNIGNVVARVVDGLVESTVKTRGSNRRSRRSKHRRSFASASL